jgi:hypothetical protein
MILPHSFFYKHRRKTQIREKKKGIAKSYEGKDTRMERISLVVF